MPFIKSYITSALCLGQAVAADVDYSQYINPFIGSEGPYEGLAFGGGDIFVGGALPFGVAKVGIDTYEQNVSYSTINGGYTPKGLVTAISMMHESGTGGGPKYGIVPQMPLTTVEAPVNILDNRTYWQQRVGEDRASVGYFATQLENGVGVEVSASRHAGIMQYSFPAGEAHVLVDVSHYLPQEAGASNSQYYVAGEMELQDDGKTYTGYTAVGGGFGEGPPITVYFCSEFDSTPDHAKTFSGRLTDQTKFAHTFSNAPVQQATLYDPDTKVTSGPLSNRVGALFSWDSSSQLTVTSRVGISFMNTTKACNYIKDEIPTWSLNDTVNAAVEEWNTDVFSKIQVPLDDSQNVTDIRLMYSSLYFMHLMPSDRTGENPLWESEEPSWDDWYTFWDIFRCTTSLYHLIQPEYYTSMLRGVIDVWRFDGFLPDGRSGNWNGLVQGGSDADNTLADAYVKGLEGVNWTAAYQAMVKDAEVVPYNGYSPIDMTNGIAQGRGALQDWLDFGYISSDSTRALSRSVEYALNDFAVAQVAKGIAPDDVEKYLKRSAGWQLTWSHNITHTPPSAPNLTFTGFLAPRKSTGEFDLEGYNPALCGGCEWSDISYEATPFEYSFTVPHDMETLIEFMGGAEKFEERLDFIFKPNSSEQDLSANGAGITTLMNIGNEPDFATPLEYHYIGKSHKSVMRTRALANQFFHDANYGVPGNSDAGALNSWLIWQMLGLYPVVTTPVYLITSPWFRDVNVSVGTNGEVLRIKAEGLDNKDSYYVQSVKVNGETWDKNWLEHEDVMKGGLIEFELGSEAKVWESGDVPPSPGHVVLPRP
ncbi:glycosyl hydrolase [Xylariaceae sp. FL1272]|nr:glycosyl hydrolase [Xylariaceae sp. FL1272]